MNMDWKWQDRVEWTHFLELVPGMAVKCIPMKMRQDWFTMLFRQGDILVLTETGCQSWVWYKDMCEIE